LFSQLSLSSTEIGAREALTKLPILWKAILIAHAPDMVAEPLPDGEDARTYARTSGSTGRPVKAVVSRVAQLLYAVLWHRQARWFGLEREKAIGELRLASQLPLDAQGQVLGLGAEANLPNWRYLGRLFRIGPPVCFALSNSYEAQLAWLERHRPACLLTYPGSLEELAFEAPDRLPGLGLQALISVGASATPMMERTIARRFGLALNQVYGLNEVGRVAVKCEHGRCHVHRESALVEIADDGHPCPPGDRGRVMVTSLANFVMPLLRHDTGDIAQAPLWVVIPCPRSGPLQAAFDGSLARPGGPGNAFSAYANTLSRCMRRATTWCATIRSITGCRMSSSLGCLRASVRRSI
jgi:phenylacetate-CoA ligase